MADTMFPRTLICFSCLLLVADTAIDFNRVVNRRVIILLTTQTIRDASASVGSRPSGVSWSIKAGKC